jgi:hypothetical protein
LPDDPKPPEENKPKPEDPKAAADALLAEFDEQGLGGDLIREQGGVGDARSHPALDARRRPVPAARLRRSRHGRVGVLLASAITLGGANEQQTITVTGAPTGGTFTLTYAGATTAAIAYNAAAAAVTAALEALPNIGAGNVVATGGALPGTPVVVTFQNALGRQNVAQMTAAHAFTGGTSPAIAVTTTTAGLGAGLGPVRRATAGSILKKASTGGGSNNVLTLWGGTGTIFGVLARTVEAFDQSDISNADVPVWTGPGCTFNDQVLALYTGYTGNEAAFLTWATANGNRVGSQGGSY